MISFQGEGLSSSSSSFMLLTKWWVPQCTECDPGTVAAKFVMDEKKPSAGSQNVCLSVCETSVIFSLFLSTYIYMPPYVQHSICNREKGSTFSERERHKQQAGGEEGKWITFEEPQNGPLLTYSNVSNRERKKWKEKKNLGPPWAGNNLQPRGRWPNRAAKRRKIRSSCWPEPSSGSSSLFPRTRKMVEFKFCFPSMTG